MPQAAVTELQQRLRLVDDAVAAIDSIPPTVVAVAVGDRVQRRRGSLFQEYAQSSIPPLLLAGLRALGPMPFGEQLDLGPVTNEERLAAEVRHAANTGSLPDDYRYEQQPRRAEPCAMLVDEERRLAELIGSICPEDLREAPHPGFTHPVRHWQGSGSRELRRATSLEWLVHCPDRCAGCMNECRAALLGVRKMLELQVREARQRAPEGEVEQDLCAAAGGVGGESRRPRTAAGPRVLDELDNLIIEKLMETPGMNRSVNLRARCKPWKHGCGLQGKRDCSAWRKRIGRLVAEGYLKRNTDGGRSVEWTGKLP